MQADVCVLGGNHDVMADAGHQHDEMPTKETQSCAVKKWLTYERFLDDAIEAAKAAGATLILAKTTNFVCSSKFTGAFAQASADFSSTNHRTRARTLDLCKTALLADYGYSAGIKGMLKELSSAAPSMAEDYCLNGVFDNSGSIHLNSRLREHIPAAKIVSSGSGGGNFALVTVFNDNAVQSCRYTNTEDGRHYHPLNTVRVRMLGNLIVQAAAAAAAIRSSSNQQ